jgi:hypothetical protein
MSEAPSRGIPFQTRYFAASVTASILSRFNDAHCSSAKRAPGPAASLQRSITRLTRGEQPAERERFAISRRRTFQNVRAAPRDPHLVLRAQARERVRDAAAADPCKSEAAETKSGRA